MLTARSLLSVAVIALATSACGKSESKGPTSTGPQGIFVSASDCAAAGKLSLDQCGAAIDGALIANEKNGKTYTSFQQCGATEGESYCDKGVDGNYRGRILAFLITMGSKPTAEPLFAATTKKEIGFRSPSKSMINALDDTLIVSSAALGVAHDNQADKKKIASKKK
jgi:hypothetical protein